MIQVPPENFALLAGVLVVGIILIPVFLCWLLENKTKPAKPPDPPDDIGGTP